MDKWMTIVEVAKYLQISKDTAYKMAQKGKIPASKVGAQWRFKKKEIDEWMDKNKNLNNKMYQTE